MSEMSELEKEQQRLYWLRYSFDTLINSSDRLLRSNWGYEQDGVKITTETNVWSTDLRASIPGFKDGWWIGHDYDWVNYGQRMKAHVLDKDREDALVLVELLSEKEPFHSYDQSDRKIIILVGQAVFEYIPKGKTIDEIVKKTVKAGSIIQYPKGTVHRFDPHPRAKTVMVEGHQPFIPLDDPRVYTTYQR